MGTRRGTYPYLRPHGSSDGICTSSALDPGQDGVQGTLWVGKKRRVKGRKDKKLLLFTLIFLILCVVGIGVAIIGYATYKTNYPKYMAIAQQGLQELHSAATLLEALSSNPFDSHRINQAQQDFSTALTDFVQVDRVMEPFPGISSVASIVSTRFRSALHLVTIAIGVSQAGVSGCKILKIFLARFQNPFSATASGLTMGDISSIDEQIHMIRIAFDSIYGAASEIQPDDLQQFDPHISKLFAPLQNELKILEGGIENLDEHLMILPELLGIGKPANYLIEVLDSSELRPGGGFIGNDGFATLSGGKLTAAHITDVDLLDALFRQTLQTRNARFPYPRAYSWFGNVLARDSWSFRDSNLDPDFPTDARYGEQNFLREGGTFPSNMPIQGVIAITPAFIEHALDITGPIFLPEYNETVTSQNLVSLIHYHQLGRAGEGSGLIASPDGYSSLRKHFSGLLAEHFLTQLRHLSPSTLPKFFQLLIRSLHTKDIQVYFNSSMVEGALQYLHLDAALQAPADDGLTVVDANMAGNKANTFILNKLDDQVTLTADGEAVHHTSISYSWVIPGQVYASAYGFHYRDYVRIYVPSNSILLSQNGWQTYEPYGGSHAFGQQVWGGYFTMNYGQTHTISLVWMVPSAVKRDANGWHYSYFLQRQAGTNWMVKLSLVLPACASLTNTSGGVLLVGNTRNELRPYMQSLDADKNLTVNYTC